MVNNDAHDNIIYLEGLRFYPLSLALFTVLLSARHPSSQSPSPSPIFCSVGEEASVPPYFHHRICALKPILNAKSLSMTFDTRIRFIRHCRTSQDC